MTIKAEFNLETISDVERAISKLISEGETIADTTGKHFIVGNEEYIPLSSPEFEDYKWVRDDHCLPHDQGFWYSSSMQDC